MRIPFRNILSIVAAMLLLFILVTPAWAASSRPINQIDTSQGEIPPTPEPGSTPSGDVPQDLPQPNLVGVFNVWYGDNQSFGHRGTPQKYINIVGNISGSSVSSMSYKLNDASPVTTDVGSGSPRLEDPGDFVISIEITDPALNVGQNTLVLSASGVTSKTINFTYVNNVVATLPYTVNWSNYTNINQGAMVVDGLWTLTGAGPRSQVTGYDRIIALGQRTWTEYEVTVPITVHSWPIAGDGGVGVILRWDGHYPNPDPILPDGWSDMGSYGYYSNDEDPNRAGLAMWLNGSRRVATGIDKFEMALGVTYIFKMRVETVTSTSARYSLKAWRQGQPEPAWESATFSEVFQVVDTNDQPQGGVLLVSHNADATFGNVTVTQLPTDNPLNKKLFIPLVRK